MSEKAFNTVFSKRLRYYLEKYGMTQNDLAKRLHVGTTSVYNWCNGIKSPRMDKVDTMCSIFHCRRSDLVEEESVLSNYTLDNIEKEIIDHYREADDISKAMVLRALSIEEPAAETKDAKLA